MFNIEWAQMTHSGQIVYSNPHKMKLHMEQEKTCAGIYSFVHCQRHNFGVYPLRVHR